LPTPAQSVIQTPFEASGLTSHAAAGQRDTVIDFVVTTLSPEGMRERTAEVYPTLAGVAGFTPKPFFCSNVKKMNHGQAVVKRRNTIRSLSAQNPLTTPAMHGNGATAKEDNSGGFAVAVFMEREKSFRHLNHLLLLTARQFGNRFKDLAEATAIKGSVLTIDTFFFLTRLG
jgi:hypothetical protein